MSVFTPGEVDYLRHQVLARMANVGPDGQPHVIPVTFAFNEDEDAVDIGGIDFAAGKKWRDARRNPKVTILIDDSPGPRQARAIEIRGTRGLHTSRGAAGGKSPAGSPRSCPSSSGCAPPRS